ncbi:FAD-dependent oxidoreductase [Bacteroides uniformis]|nr:FAD-dependent oxidoreductase [Bacteroides uniformis]
MPFILPRKKGSSLPLEATQLTDFRKKMLDIPAEPEQYSYDVIVTGGGIAGMCAAATASRLGCKVALINDRPVLGGNNSSEVGGSLRGQYRSRPQFRTGTYDKRIRTF